jgi:hypothetical protein
MISLDSVISRGTGKATQQFFDPQVALLQQAKAQLDALYAGHFVETLTANGYAPLQQTYDIITANVA